MDALFQDILGKADEGDIARFQRLVFLGQDPGLMVELVDAARKLIDVGTDQVRGRGLQGGLHGGAELGDGEHQILGVGVGGHLDGEVVPGLKL